MNSKLIIVAIALVLIVVTILVYMNLGAITPITTSSTDVSQASIVVGSEYSDLIEEQMNSLSIDQPSFVTDTQDSMANDLSQFYY